MAVPRVFVSSTCFDLKHVRERLRFFIETLGYVAVLSEEGDVFYDPGLHTHDSCLAEVPTCQMLVLIVGGRFGGSMRGSNRSITNAEFQAAVSHKVPIFALVDQAVYSEQHVYKANVANEQAQNAGIVYPAVDDVRIFKFIDEVRHQSINNAIYPFRNYSEIEEYLRKQWAGLMYNTLVRKNESDRVASVMEEFALLNKKIEFITQQLVNQFGTPQSKLLVEMYNELIGRKMLEYLITNGGTPSPQAVLKYSTFQECVFGISGKPIELLSKEEEEGLIRSGNKLSEYTLRFCEREYKELRERLLEMASAASISVESLLSEGSPMPKGRLVARPTP